MFALLIFANHYLFRIFSLNTLIFFFFNSALRQWFYTSLNFGLLFHLLLTLFLYLLISYLFKIVSLPTLISSCYYILRQFLLLLIYLLLAYFICFYLTDLILSFVFACYTYEYTFMQLSICLILVYTFYMLLHDFLCWVMCIYFIVLFISYLNLSFYFNFIFFCCCFLLFGILFCSHLLYFSSLM